MKFTPIAVTAAAVGILGAAACLAQTANPPASTTSPGKAQTMKQCMDTEAAKNSGKTQGEMTQTCNDQMKLQKAYEHLSEAPATTPEKTDSTRTPAPK